MTVWKLPKKVLEAGAALQSVGGRYGRLVRIFSTWALAILTLSFLVGSLFIQRSKQEASVQFAELVGSGAALPLSKFQADFLSCTGTGERRLCDTISSGVDLVFPDAKGNEQALAELSRPATHVQLRHPLDARERKWIDSEEVASLVLVRNIQVETRLLNPPETLSIGNGSTSAFRIDRKAIATASGEVRLEMLISGLPRFGPHEFPIALVKEDAIAEYQALAFKQISSAEAGRQLQLAIPFVLVIFALILDHSSVFSLLAALAGFRAIRAFLAVLLETAKGDRLHDAYPFVTKGAFGLINGLVAASFLGLAFTLAKTPRALFRRFAFLLFLVPAAFIVHGFFSGGALLSGDVLADALGAGGAGIILVAAISRNLRRSDTGDADAEGGSGATVNDFRRARIEGLAELASLGIGALAFGLLAFANFVELASDDGAKSIIDWKYALFYPGMLLLAFVRVGASSSIIRTTVSDLVRKRILESELDTAKRQMRAMQGPRRGLEAGVEWRAWQRQCVSVGGDFYDVRRLDFANGNSLLIAAVIDVTGHGIQAAMIARSISDAWGAWCSDLVQARKREGDGQDELRACPESREEKETLLTNAPRRLRAHLSSGRVLGSCTAVFALFDPRTREVTVCNAAHPAPMALSASGHRNLAVRKRGSSIYGPVPDPEWSAETIKIENETVYLFSDGLFTDNGRVSMSSFQKRTYRFRARPPESFDPNIMWKVFWDSARLFRSTHPDDEDDITLVSLRFEESFVRNYEAETQPLPV